MLEGFTLWNDDGEYRDYERIVPTNLECVSFLDRVTEIVDTGEWYGVRLLSDLSKSEDESFGECDTVASSAECLTVLESFQLT